MTITTTEADGIDWTGDAGDRLACDDCGGWDTADRVTLVKTDDPDTLRAVCWSCARKAGTH